MVPRQRKSRSLRPTRARRPAVRESIDADSRGTAAARLAFWTLRNWASAAALVSGGEVGAVNARWEELESAGRGARWELFPPLEGMPPTSYANLAELALGQTSALVGRGPAAFSRMFRQARGASERFIEVYIDVPDRASGAYVLIHDVTRAVRADRELAQMRSTLRAHQSLESLGKLASSIAHDFNNSFFAMRLRLERMMSDAPPPMREQLSGLLELLADESKRVRRIKEFAGPLGTAGAAPTDLCAIVRETLELAREHVRHEAERSGRTVDFELKLPPQAPVRADPAELRPVLLNILLNASEAMPEGGRIRVAVRREKRETVLEVRDTGPGIAPEHLEAIFEPLFTTKPGRGTGLGLSTARELMANLGGSIRAENLPRGGALFRLAFPKLGEPGPAKLRRRIAAKARRRILVIDDQLEVLEGVRLALRGHDVELALTGRDALERVGRGERFDLVICDLGLPGLDGLAVAEALHERAPKLPVVVLTGWADGLPPRDPRRRHVLEVLDKPLSVEQLEAAIERATHAKRRR